ncbi:MAG: hypothetical protein M3247_02160 [Thermoproteota archaeon]|nr:hypothetical protein [Thermoproteota archaeon]
MNHINGDDDDKQHNLVKVILEEDSEYVHLACNFDPKLRLAETLCLPGYRRVKVIKRMSEHEKKDPAEQGLWDRQIDQAIRLPAPFSELGSKPLCGRCWANTDTSRRGE